LRREIETAIDGKRNIVPLMLEGFDFGTPKIANQLKGRIAALKRYNGLNIPPDYFLEAMERLREKHLNISLSAVLHPIPLSTQRATTEQKKAASSAPVVRQSELTAQQWFERGYAASDHDEEIRFFTEAIRLKPDYALAFYNRAVARGEKGDIDGEIADYDEAIRLDPEDAEARNNRGAARFGKGDLQGAIEDYNEAIRLRPNYAAAFYNRGNARREKGDVRGAQQDLKRAQKLAATGAQA
jgi:tetratricopeptide (TPR) repeat protein